MTGRAVARWLCRYALQPHDRRMLRRKRFVNPSHDFSINRPSGRKGHKTKESNDCQSYLPHEASSEGSIGCYAASL
jgi:hypothetical protein